MASINSTSSLGNTSLRGFGGMASGIDRDSIIEKMTLGTTTKINNQKKKVTELQWKQEAYRGISDKIIDWSDTYASYASSNNLKDPTVFSKNQITVHGKEDSKNLVSVNGSSDLIDSLSILAVNQTASAAVRQSQTQTSDKGLQLNMGNLCDITYEPVLGSGSKLVFESVAKNDQGKPLSTVQFTFSDKYTDPNDPDGKKKITINYAPQTEDDYKALETALNEQLKASDVKLGEKALSDEIEFVYNQDIDNPSITIRSKTGNSEYSLKGNVTSEAFGYGSENIKLSEINGKTPTSFSKTGVRTKNNLDAITNKEVTFVYNGTSKSIKLITKAEADAIKSMLVGDDLAGEIENIGSYNGSSKLSDLQNDLSKRLNEIKTALGKPEQLNKQIAGIDKIRGEFQQKIDDLTAKLDSATGADKENLQQEIEQYTNEMGRLDAQKKRFGV